MLKRMWVVGEKYGTMMSTDGWTVYRDEGDPNQKVWDHDDHRMWVVEHNGHPFIDRRFARLETALCFLESHYPDA